MELDASLSNLYKVDKLIDDRWVKQQQNCERSQGVVPVEENYGFPPTNPRLWFARIRGVRSRRPRGARVAAPALAVEAGPLGAVLAFGDGGGEGGGLGFGTAVFGGLGAGRSGLGGTCNNRRLFCCRAHLIMLFLSARASTLFLSVTILSVLRPFPSSVQLLRNGIWSRGVNTRLVRTPNTKGIGIVIWRSRRGLIWLTLRWAFLLGRRCSPFPPGWNC